MENIIVVNIPFNQPYSSNNFLSAKEKLVNWLKKHCIGKYELIAEGTYGRTEGNRPEMRYYQFHVEFENSKDKFHCYLVWK
jgi:hypothetical protein